MTNINTIQVWFSLKLANDKITKVLENKIILEFLNYTLSNLFHEFLF